MTGGKQAQDPTMDEILSSIRKIIEQDASRPPVVPPAPSPAAGRPVERSNVTNFGPVTADATRQPSAPPVDDDVLLLTNLIQEPIEAPSGVAPTAAAVPVPPKPVPAPLSTIGPQPTVSAPVVAAPPAAATPPATAMPAMSGPAVVVEPAAREPGSDQPPDSDPIRAAMDRLARAVTEAEPRVEPIDPGPTIPVGRTLEDVVRDMLRPMLQDWIDRNLPPLVERIIERELRQRSKP